MDRDDIADEGPGLTRRDFVAAGGAAVAWSLLGKAGGAAAASMPAPGASAGPAPNPVSFGDIPVTLREGTNVSIALSPDGKTIAMDLQGILWLMPAEGGEARQLTGYLDDIARPDWSPDGGMIAFQSYRDGNFHIWTINSDGSGLLQRTSGLFDCREPRYAPDGRRILFASDCGGNYGIYVLDLRSGDVTVVVDTPHEDSEPVFSPDGRRVAFVSGGQLIVLDEQGAQTVVAQGAVNAPAWTPDGRGLVYRVASGTPRDMRSSRLYRSGVPITGEDEDVFPFPVSWLSADEIFYTADGRIKRRHLAGGDAAPVPFTARVTVAHAGDYPRRRRDFDSEAPRPVKGISFPVLSPDGGKIAFTALGQLWCLDVGTARPRQLTDDSYAKTYPAWSPDGKWLAYSCDRGGKLDIWLRDLASGEERQLSRSPSAMKQSSWSPDSTRIACASQDGYLYVLDVASGAMTRLLHQTVWSGRASWSKAGDVIALAAVQPYSSRYREGVNAILTCELSNGETAYHLPGPGLSLDVRNVNGPIWSPDGTAMAFTMKGTLWSMPVDPRGRPTGAPRPLNDETTDSISWSGDGGKILYLSNGSLRLLTMADGSIETLPLSFTWALAKPSGLQVVHAGRMWDGRAEEMRSDVDILIEGNRIAAVEPHRPDRGDAAWIDAGRRTVMPGLIDMHTHREMGNQFGDREPRIFLAFGVTATRGLSDNPYLAIENRESVDAGRRVGPRHFATGDALDGSRVFWDGMRPISDDGQLERELSKAEALEYDLLKCYVRLPLRLQRRVVAFGHSIGIPVTSHYLFPAVAFGADGHEHMGGTSRFGFSRTGSSLGRIYQDVLAIASGCKGFRTPTLFGLEGMLGDWPGLLDDPRLSVLFPAWEQAPLRKAAAAGPSKPVPMVAHQVEGVMSLMREGVKIVTGTDYPIVAPALSMHLNLRAMVRYGMRPVDALRSATSVSGDVLGQGIGAIEAGKLADIIVVDGDPLRVIDDAARVEQVMVNGFLHDVEGLIAPFRGKDAGAATETPQHATAGPAAQGPLRLASKSRHWWHDERWVEEVRRSCCLPT
ncbi:amidohydrolase family protein [Telmatospirillum siberiense]|nr:amidohydrolase family protein [Telmatospirillum siberiense]